MLVNISIRSPFDGRQIAYKTVPFYKDLLRTEYHAILYYCRHNALDSVDVYFNNHKLSFTF